MKVSKISLNQSVITNIVFDKLINFSDNGCQDHYEPAGDICIRPSVYPETYENAQLKCQSEGGSLLSITSQEVQVDYDTTLLKLH